MSGGVDSAVAAGLLVREGHEVVGLTMNLWPDWLPEPDDAFKACCGVSAIDDARAVARHLGIRHYVLNMREEFEREVIGYFVDEYARGRTPNPCIACNQSIKFSLLLRKVRALGLDALATGHYARIASDPATGRWGLWRGRDRHKDQSYVLYGLTQVQLQMVRLPVGEFDKTQIRATAHRMELPVADKPDSQEICFVPRGTYADVVQRLRPQAVRPGPILDTSGRVVGTHQGITRFTIGQRRGLGVAAGVPQYVVGIDPARNAVILGHEEDLLCDGLTAGGMNWIAITTLDGPMSVTARLRHASRDVDATVTPAGPAGDVTVRFATPQRAAAPGQAIVFYNGDIVIGGGTIAGIHTRVHA
jgi:tRNA-specific 2-thiouridylase